MRALLSAFLLSTSLHAAQLTATDAFKQILMFDTYEGLNDEGEDCQVDIFGSPAHTLIEIESYGIVKFMLRKEAIYTWDLSQRQFSSSLLVSNQGNGGQTEITFSTQNQAGKLRVTIQRTHQVNGRQWTSVQDCTL